jgi:hypothetical protein
VLVPVAPIVTLATRLEKDELLNVQVPPTAGLLVSVITAEVLPLASVAGGVVVVNVAGVHVPVID